MASHEAGALHADAGSRGPLWLRVPADINTLVPRLWPRLRQALGELRGEPLCAVPPCAGHGWLALLAV